MTSTVPAVDARQPNAQALGVPLLKITTTQRPDASATQRLLGELSNLVATRLGKPEAYVMTSLEPGVTMTFAGTTEPACYVEFKNVGRFAPEATKRLSAELCSRLETALAVPQGRIYIEFADAAGHLWGHDGDTFG